MILKIEERLAPYFILILLSFLGISCANKKDIIYFQAENKESDTIHIENKNKYTAKIKIGDVLSIMVSSLSPEASAMFNPFAGGAADKSNTLNSGYLVDEDGQISLPLIGKLRVLDLSTKQATDLILLSLNKYLQQPTVSIRILNFKISVLGEVVNPNVYTIPNEIITLPEALGLAGDLTISGKRGNVLLIREIDGKREFIRIDITKRDLFSSPYYYLHANDILYVEPSKGKIISTDSSVQLLPVILSSLSVLTIIFTSLIK